MAGESIFNVYIMLHDDEDCVGDDGRFCDVCGREIALYERYTEDRNENSVCRDCAIAELEAIVFDLCLKHTTDEAVIF